MTAEFTKAVKDDLIAKLKNVDSVDATGWYVQITFSIETAIKKPAQLYLKLNGEQLPNYPLPVQDGESVPISYYTDSDNSSLAGYIQYPDRRMETVSTGTRYNNQ